jgi:N-acetylglucosamine-6-phosphate deacetylase
MTLDKNELSSIFQTAVDPLPLDCATIAGINMEGPFIATSKKGAQNGKYIQSPNVTTFCELNAAARHLIKLVTLAPELENSIEFIRAVSDEITVSIGHTNADYETAKQAIEAGATHITHLYNAMPPYHHREPGVIGAAADSTSAMVELICDGIHIHPAVIRNTFRQFGDDRVILISDSMMATGMPDGTYELGRQTVYMKEKHAVLEDGTLAGSASNLFDCMKNAVSFGIPLETAIQSATENPARSIGIFDQVGSLSNGKRADIVIMDKNHDILRIL